MHLPLPGEPGAPCKSLIFLNVDVHTPTSSYQLLNNEYQLLLFPLIPNHMIHLECSASKATWQLGLITYFFSCQVKMQEATRELA